MSEKIYAWLLRLYPRCFREDYGTSAMQLFRDRLRAEDRKAFCPPDAIRLLGVFRGVSTVPSEHVAECCAYLRSLVPQPQSASLMPGWQHNPNHQPS